MSQRFVCFFLGHAWSKYSGYYEERVANGAICLREGCEKKYEDTRSGRPAHKNVDNR